MFHQGLTALINRWVPLSYGTVITIVSVFVLLLWIPLRQRPGIGTVANAAIIGFTTDATLRVLPGVQQPDRPDRGAGPGHRGQRTGRRAVHRRGLGPGPATA